jgi:tRNA (guanine26-N2/guanine27-N2)-dimethyltransferase
MALDRDLAVAVARAFFPTGPEERTGWETTAATGIRGLRLLREAERFSRFRLSEASDRSFPVLAGNAARYPGAEAVHEDARVMPPTIDGAVAWVDVDPYGTPLPYLDAAFGALARPGVLAVTATDMMVLAGAQPSATRRLYGAVPVRGRLGPEGGLRILLARLASVARTHGRRISPLVAYVGDHHVRAYLHVLPADTSSDPVGAIVPSTYAGPSLGTDAEVGPMWLGPIFDPGLVRRLEPPTTVARPRELVRLLERFREESEVPTPFYYEANRLASGLGLAEPPSLARLLEGLRAAGFRASRTHARPEGFRTDAPRAEVERVARGLVRG